MASHLESFHALFIHDLCDLYDAEHQILEALPKMVRAANSDELKKAFEAHHKQSKTHVDRLEKVFASIDERPKRMPCAGMKGLLEEGEKILQGKDSGAPEVLDCALICSAQKVEHYEISGYGSARAFAELMGHDEAAKLLEETLDEESETDEKLNALAEDLNPRAMKVASGMEEAMVL